MTNLLRRLCRRLSPSGGYTVTTPPPAPHPDRHEIRDCGDLR